MRWVAAKLDWLSSRPSPDIMVFAVFHEAAESAVLDRSTALQKGLIAVTNLFADRSARGSNQVVLAHELLHTLGATDKYDGPANLPRYPEGFADPSASPSLPQIESRAHGGPNSDRRNPRGDSGGPPASRDRTHDGHGDRLAARLADAARRPARCRMMRRDAGDSARRALGNRLSKIYTRTGDDGTTGLANGERVDKCDVRVEAFG